MFHACVQRFDGMDEKNLGRELNRALRKYVLHINCVQLVVLWLAASYHRDVTHSYPSLKEQIK